MQYTVNPDDSRKQRENAAKYTLNADEEDYLTTLVRANVTLDDEKDTRPSAVVTNDDLYAKRDFTDEFLAFIHQMLIRRDPTFIDLNNSDFLWDQIALIFKNNGAYKWETTWGYMGLHYYASNTLYFLLIANIYYNILRYTNYFPWLSVFLLHMERGDPPLTGEFTFFNKDQYAELFQKGHGKGIDFKLLPSAEDVVQQELKLSNSNVNLYVEHIKYDKKPCPHGASCFRQHNPQHTMTYSHPLISTTPGTMKPKTMKAASTRRTKTAAKKGGAKHKTRKNHKIKSHKNHKTRKTRKSHKKKQIKRK